MVDERGCHASVGQMPTSFSTEPAARCSTVLPFERA